MKRIPSLRAGRLPTLLALMAVASAPLSGCGCHAPQNPGRWIVAIDRSESTAAPTLRTRQLEALDAVAAQAEGRRDSVDVWAFDNNAERLFGPATETDGLEAVKAKQLGQSAPRRRVTRPGVLLEKLAADTETARLPRSAPLRLVLLTDGGIDDAADLPRLRKACQTLAKDHPNLTVRVIGIDPEARDAWSKSAGVALSDFQAVGLDEADRTLRDLERGLR